MGGVTMRDSVMAPKNERTAFDIVNEWVPEVAKAERYAERHPDWTPEKIMQESARRVRQSLMSKSPLASVSAGVGLDDGETEKRLSAYRKWVTENHVDGEKASERYYNAHEAYVAGVVALTASWLDEPSEGYTRKGKLRAAARKAKKAA